MKLLTGLQRPVQERTFVPDAHGTEGYLERNALVSACRIVEDGPDARVTIFTRGSAIPLGQLKCFARDADALAARLFHETPRLDRECFQRLMDDLEESFASGNAGKRTLVRRQLMATLDALAADLAAIAGSQA